MPRARRQAPVRDLDKKRKALISRFLKGQAPKFFEEHAECFDTYFRRSFAQSSEGLRLGVDKNPYAVIALGGYGRKEQCIFSDVDVLLLFEKRVPEQAKALVQELIYPLWDIGIDVGHATRSIKECLTLASRDFEVLTALIDSRFICGISSLYLDLGQRLSDKVIQKRRRPYLDWLSEQNKRRHTHFGDSTYLLEPNLKEGLGGLRDFHAMLWAARVAWGIRNLRELEFLGHLSHEEFSGLRAAVSFVKTVRNWLHHMNRRKCDQLYFEYQIRIADALGFCPEDGQQGVEKFLSTLHNQMEFLKHLHLTYLLKATKKRRRSSQKSQSERLVSPGILLAEDHLEFVSPEAIAQDPFLLIRIFEKSGALAKPLGVTAARLVGQFLYLVDPAFRRSKKTVKAFRRILCAAPRQFNVLHEMLYTGMLVALIPEMAGVVDRIQYDEYHLYPVDKHLLRTVQTLKALRDADTASDDAFFKEIFDGLENPERLFWAGLLHDLGKGERTTDLRRHAHHGAHMVKAIFARMGLAENDAESVRFLVQEHLLLIHTATRRDINDEMTIVRCARKVPDIDHLNMLLLLSVADARATGPKAWNAWTAALVKELFFKVRRVLEAGELGTREAGHLVEEKRQAVFEAFSDMSEERLAGLFGQFSPRYLLYTTVEDMVAHIKLYHALGESPSILGIRSSSGTLSRKVTVCAHDFPGLFCKVAGVFALHGLDILSAQIYTWKNRIALDIFDVKPPADDMNEARTWRQVDSGLRDVLTGKIDLADALEKKMGWYRSHDRRVPLRPAKIVFDNHSSDFFTIIEIYTHDFLGLLYKITSALFQCGLDIHFAKIGTRADQVVDVFYVRDLNAQKIEDPDQIAIVEDFVKGVLMTGPQPQIHRGKNED